MQFVVLFLKPLRPHYLTLVANAKAKQVQDQKVEEETQKLNDGAAQSLQVQLLKEAEARAVVHTVGQTVASAQTSIDKYQQQIMQQLGVDLSGVLIAVRE